VAANAIRIRIGGPAQESHISRTQGFDIDFQALLPARMSRWTDGREA